MTDDLACLMYLLAHDDASEGPYDRSRTELLVRAAALADLALRGRLGEVDGTVTVSGTRPTGDPVLDGVLRDAAAGHGWKHLVCRHRRRTLTQVEDWLATAGLLTVKAPRSRFGRRRLTMSDPAVSAALRARVSMALRRDGPVTGIPPGDAALLALAAAGGIRSVVSRQDHKNFRTRMDAGTEHLATFVPGLVKVIRTLPMTMIAAQGGMGGS